MSVAYEAALETLHSMFSGVDMEVVAAVLESNGGHMEKTIDNLLMMVGEKPIQDEEVRVEPAQQSQIDADALLARMLQDKLFRDQIRADPQFRQAGGFSGAVPSPSQPYRESDLDELDLGFDEVKKKFSQMGEAAKSRLRELSMKFRRPDARYAPVSVDEETEVLNADSSVTRRKTQHFDDLGDGDDDFGERDDGGSPGLVNRRRQGKKDD